MLLVDSGAFCTVVFSFASFFLPFFDVSRPRYTYTSSSSSSSSFFVSSSSDCCLPVVYIMCTLRRGVAVHAMWQYSVFLCMQGGVFLAFGLNYVDGN